ncbi:MAG: PD-(D/E)XK nuclease family protein [Nanoarchaeota archaeon]|nr:PD-(D/E)XK nuclease family protein [Nanoarchaeota archaeon]MBU1631874.1 PD-(D/E)XK nuclease family protein [Nanoarchaeota archaeon]MBU1875939.1 PD-(D/E)XK nuclease family protein [Nanoarchaeota archaeon]
MAKRVESPSSINTFKQCQRKYYYQYVKKLPTIPNIHQIRGNIAHSTLENLYDIDVSLFNEENYETKFKEAIQKLLFFYWKKYEPKLKTLNLNKDQERFYFEETMLMVMNWINHFIKEIDKLMKEKNISLQEAFQQLTPIREQKYVSDNYSVQGFIDAIHLIEEEVHIVDYKTNANFEFKDSIKLQLAIYSLLYFEKHGKLPSKVGVFFLRHKLKLMNVEEELLELAKREIGLIHSHTSITEKISDYPRCITPLCKWSTGKCDFYEVCKPHK